MSEETQDTLFIVNWLSLSVFLENGGQLEIESISKSKAQNLAKGKRLVSAIQPITFPQSKTLPNGLGLSPELISAEVKRQLVLQAGEDSPLVVNDSAVIGDYAPLRTGTEIMLAELYVAEAKLVQPKSTVVKRAIPGRKEMQIQFGISFFLIRCIEACPSLPRLELPS